MMDLKEAQHFAERMIDNGNKSDGCTFAPDLGIRRWCVMHDMLRRFSPVSSLRADNLFFQGIASEGLRYVPVACIYWFFVRLQALIGDVVGAVMITLFLIIISIMVYFSN